MDGEEDPGRQVERLTRTGDHDPVDVVAHDDDGCRRQPTPAGVREQPPQLGADRRLAQAGDVRPHARRDVERSADFPALVVTYAEE